MNWLKRSIGILKGGGIIAFPTDTVYGIGCDATLKEAIEKIYQIKHRVKDKPLIMFIPSSDKLEKSITHSTRLIDKLSKYFWPGPLTLVIKTNKDVPIKAKDGTIGIRVPDEKHILALLNNYPNPLATTSCNVENLPVLSNVREIKRIFGKDIDYVIEGKTPEPAIPSTVLSLSPPILLRRGKVSLFEIEQKTGVRVMLSRGMRIRVLFVCTANLCRSQIAEGLARQIRPMNVFVGSAGVHTTDGSTPSLLAMDVMLEENIDISGQLSRQITREVAYNYDLILCMEEKNRQWIVSHYPEISSRIFILGEFGRDDRKEEIEDPIRGGIEEYRISRDRIRIELERIFGYLEERYFL